MMSLSPRSARFAPYLASITTAALSFADSATAATSEELEAKLQALAEQVQALQGEVATLRAQNAEAPAQVSAAQSQANGPSNPEAALEAPRLEWFGYGEINYSRPTGDPANTVADVARFVLGA